MTNDFRQLIDYQIRYHQKQIRILKKLKQEIEISKEKEMGAIRRT